MPEKNFIDYDQVTYPNFVHAQTHPNRLATMARAYGLRTAPVERCRVLEVGCGSGTNLLAMACALPESRFVGIDLAENHIRFGREAVSALGAENLELICADLLTADLSDLGEFDYIIAHGFFSWVPGAVRKRFLEICRERLAENGVAFVSYNAFPGCHLRLMMREMMLYHTENVEAPAAKVEQSLALLGFLKDAAFEREIYAKILQNEFEKTVERRAEIIIHDDLGGINQPFYFHEFMDEAEAFDLEFLSEAEYFHDKFTSFSREAVALLERFGDEQVVRREQYLDFLKNRRFRQTLLCRKGAGAARRVREDFFDALGIVCDMRPESENPDFAPQTIERFVKAGKDGVTIDHPLTKAALFHLCEIFPQSARFDELVPAAEELVKKQMPDFAATETDREILKDILLKIFGSEMVNFFVYEPEVTGAVSDRPKTDPFVRWQARTGSETVFSRRHRTKKIEDDLVRTLLALADGERTVEQIVADFKEMITDGRIRFEAAGEAEKQEFIAQLPAAVEGQLRQAAKFALFVS